MQDAESHIDRLRNDLKKIGDRCIALLRCGRIDNYVRKQNPMTAFGSGKQKPPEIRFRWAQLEPSEAREQSKLVQEFNDLSEEILGLINGLSPGHQSPMKNAVRKVSEWIQHRSSRF